MMARPRVPPDLTDSRTHRRMIARAVSLAQDGQVDVTQNITLVANAATTTVVDSRIGPTTAALLQPTTAHAAAEIAAGGLFPSPITQAGTLTINHANNAQIDRTFVLMLIG